MKFTLRRLFVATSLVAVVVWLVVNEPWHKQWRRRHHMARVAEIVSTAKNLGVTGHPWAGDYRNQDLLLGIMPQAGWVSQALGEFGVYDQNYGELQESNDTIRLTKTFVDSRIPDELQIVRWGGRVYLIDPYQLDKFRTAINEGAEPRTVQTGDFLLRLGDESKAVVGLPPVFAETVTAELDEQRTTD